MAEDIQRVGVFIDCMGNLSVCTEHRTKEGKRCVAKVPTLGIPFILIEATNEAYKGKCGVCGVELIAPLIKLMANG